MHADNPELNRAKESARNASDVSARGLFKKVFISLLNSLWLCCCLSLKHLINIRTETRSC